MEDVIDATKNGALHFWIGAERNKTEGIDMSEQTSVRNANADFHHPFRTTRTEGLIEYGVAMEELASSPLGVGTHSLGVEPLSPSSESLTLPDGGSRSTRISSSVTGVLFCRRNPLAWRSNSRHRQISNGRLIVGIVGLVKRSSTRWCSFEERGNIMDRTSRSTSP